MNERDFRKLAAPMARRLQNMIARGVVLLTNAGTKMQELQVRLLADEDTDQLEHWEPYGFTSRPQPGAEAAVVFVDGDRSHGLCLVVADRRYRMKGFEAGEMAIHDDQGQSVHLTRDGIVIKGAGLPIRIEDTPSVTIDAPQTILTGNLQLAGSLEMTGASGTGAQVRGPLAVTGGSVTHDGTNIGKTHVHNETGSVTAGPH